MVKARLTVRKIQEILRLHYAGLSDRKVSQALFISKTTVKNIVCRFESSGLQWPLPEDVTEESLRDKLYASQGVTVSRPIPDWEYIHQELSRPHVTRYLLWQEYRQTHPKGIGISQFYNLYRQYKKCQIEPVLHIEHKGGDKLFIDYSGKKLSYIDQSTGEIVPVEVFVCSWGASGYSYVEATHSQCLEDWICSHVRAFRYFNCVANLLIPDNLKSGVTKADRYDPDLNPLYARLAEHYDTAILPARPKKPRDKAVVEGNVGFVQNFIFARLRNRTFFSLAEVNEAIRELLEELNNRPMQRYGLSRRERFEKLDKPYAKPLPAEDFPYIEIKDKITVHKDYHIEYEKHFYSVPYTLCGEQVTVLRTNKIIEVYHNFQRVASHQISYRLYKHSTKDEHMPPNHKFVKGWSPGYFLNRAVTIGPNMIHVVKIILDRKRHPEIGYRSALGILQLERKYGKQRLERAAQRAAYFNTVNRQSFISILEQKLDQQPLEEEKEVPKQQTLFHKNIRGAEYYNH
ncbi:MAG: IS21 family transposase [Elusimicrobia bacterium]|nr:IS21 family transposase [Elusimicrobiota bacterium]